MPSFLLDNPIVCFASKWEPFFSIISGIAAVIAIIYGAFQLRQAKKVQRADLLLKLTDEWRDPVNYESFRYIHKLRKDWLATGFSIKAIQKHAAEWVANHSEGGENREEEWVYRRNASQLLATFGTMLIRKQIHRNDLFAIIPEAGSLLVILQAIENEIEKKFARNKSTSIADWDRPYPKWQFQRLMKEYEVWYKKTGKKQSEMKIRLESFSEIS